MMRPFWLVWLLVGCSSTPEATAPPVAEADVTVRPSSSCAPRAVMVAGLARRYGEVSVATGIAQHGTIVEVFTADEGVTFSIVYSSIRTGVSCIVFHGEGWKFLEYKGGDRA